LRRRSTVSASIAPPDVREPPVHSTPSIPGPEDGPSRPRKLTDLTSLEQARRIAALCEEKLATDVTILDMRTVCDYTDFFVIASGRNARQTKAVHDEVLEALKREHGMSPRSVSGLPEASWIVDDYLDVVLHLFTPETRRYYRLEDLWSDVPAVELEAATG
jgi:ribosome-associated protein